MALTRCVRSTVDRGFDPRRPVYGSPDLLAVQPSGSTVGVALDPVTRSGLTISDNGDGTAIVSGDAHGATDGTHHLVLGASNGVSLGGFQPLTVTVLRLFSMGSRSPESTSAR